MRVGRLIITAIFVLGLAACASTGVKVDQSKLSLLTKGKTTYEEAIQAFGKPTNTIMTDDGSKIISYNFISYQARPETFIPIVGAFAGGADTETSFLNMTFDQNNILQKYTSSQGGMGAGKNLEGISQDRKSVRAVE